MKIAKQTRKRVILAAGGTGGHIFPAMAVAEALMNQNYRVLLITDRNFNKFRNLFQPTLRRINFSVYYAKILRRSGLLGRAMMSIEAGFNIFTIARQIIRFKGVVVVGFGSYVSLPSVIAGFLTLRKTMLHEQNSVLGLANRIGIWFSYACMCGFHEVNKVPIFNKKKMVFTGNPIRKDFIKLYDNRKNNNINYKAFFNIYETINIVVMGGSQGAAVFEEFVPAGIGNLPSRIKAKIKVYHQAPYSRISSVLAAYNSYQIEAQVRNFFIDAPGLMSAAHIFISRSGASTISEIACLGAPSILVPYPNAAHNHQYKNALFLQKYGGAIVMEQESITADKLSQTLNLMLSEDNLLFKMSSSAKELAQPSAHFKVAAAIEVLMYGKRISVFNDYQNNKILIKNVGTS